MVAIVAEMTGYPAELLDLDLDLEADLGVDTVKQAEVFAAVRERFGVERDENLQLRDFPTLTHVIGWVRDKTGIQPAAAHPAAPCRSGRSGCSTRRRRRPRRRRGHRRRVTIVAEMTGYPADCWTWTSTSRPTWGSTPSSRPRCSPRSASGSASNATRTCSCATSRP